MGYLETKLEVDAQQLADTVDLPVFLRRLGATRAAVDGNASSPTAAVVSKTRVHVGLSAVVTWFSYPPTKSVCAFLVVSFSLSVFERASSSCTSMFFFHSWLPVVA